MSTPDLIRLVRVGHGFRAEIYWRYADGWRYHQSVGSPTSSLPFKKQWDRWQANRRADLAAAGEER